MTLICPHNRPIGQLANDLERVPEELAWSIKATNDAYEQENTLGHFRNGLDHQMTMVTFRPWFDMVATVIFDHGHPMVKTDFNTLNPMGHFLTRMIKNNG